MCEVYYNTYNNVCQVLLTFVVIYFSLLIVYRVMRIGFQIVFGMKQ